jgi:DNA replication protein DnaC
MKEIRQIIRQTAGTTHSVNKFQGIEESVLKRKFIEHANEFVRKTNPNSKFEVDQSNKEIISDLFCYFIGKEGKLDLNKGIWMMGEPGTGKSALLYIFSSFLRSFRYGFKVHTANDIAIQFEQTGEIDLYTSNSSGYSGKPVELAIDEIGHEPRPSVHFGTKRNVIQYILHTRYGYWQHTGLKTYSTTNIDMNEVELNYGDAIRDRIPHMFNVVHVGGDSRRK